MTTETQSPAPTVRPNIYQRINSVRKAIGYIQKDKAVSTGGGSYRAVSHDAVIGMLREHLIDYGIVVTTSLVIGEFDPPAVNADGSHAKQRLYRAEFLVTFINADNPEDRFFNSYPAHALDNGDKAPGKAISYATKYALLKTFNIETGEDEESRYQGTDFDIVPFLETIEASKNLPELKEAYTSAYAAATAAKDRDAQAAVVKCKNRIKSIIEASDSVVGQA